MAHATELLFHNLQIAVRYDNTYVQHVIHTYAYLEYLSQGFFKDA